MTKRMLIDATHDEETRVAVVEGKRGGNRLEEFDYESKFRKPLKGNIFLAKVTRVEPSLQAAFVNFGGNRHGFLPFSEIHPDYFRIPIADREALIAEQEAAIAEAEAKEEELEAEDARRLEEEDKEGAQEEEHAEDADDPGADEEKPSKSKRKKPAKKTSKAKTKKESEDQPNEDDMPAPGNEAESEDEDEINGNVINDEEENDIDGNVAGDDEENSGGRGRGRGRRGGRGGGRGGRGGRGRGRGRAARSRGKERYDDDDHDEERRFRFNLRRKYKIQEVIKRGQIMLIQVNKEERGNKGAAVGTYLSLPGRYCVLMPNSPRAGGVSRKIANYKDRARMREIIKELDVPKGMSVILRTAGVSRTKTEIKRDLDYLMRLWDKIRELTLESSAPSLVYEEADLIKRSIRDLYTRDIDEIHVAGEEGFKAAKDFMKMMIPSHVKKVQEYKDESLPLFNKFKVEDQIAEIGETQVTLPSGGYLVINPTEALVSIDVNSGKATKERHIEETALKTNLETAEEVARQLRLRDLGGLVVIDFIDMEDRRNNGKVERKMREAISNDRARIQMGRISNFGLMELSRQRLNPSLTESQFETCSHCNGTGRVRTADGTAIMVLRGIEEEGMKARAAQLIVHVSNNVAQYMLNNMRKRLADLEERYEFTVLIRVDDSVGTSGFRIEVSKPADKEGAEANEDEDKEAKKGRRRGRRGGRGRGRRGKGEEQVSLADELEQGLDSEEENQEEEKKPKDKKPKKAQSKTAKKDEKTKEKTEKKTTKKTKAEEESADAKAQVDKKPKKAEKKSEKSEEKPKKKAVKASNDDKDAVKDYEKVNEAPKEKKKGWWSK